MTEIERAMRRMSGGELPKRSMLDIPSEFCVVNDAECDPNKCFECSFINMHLEGPRFCEHPARPTRAMYPECVKTCPKNIQMTGGI